ncbi:MAG TPA: ATP-dependent helicase HrpB [bacterium]|nr:ATP-dependent helicase HrpB [bacterium]
MQTTEQRFPIEKIVPDLIAGLAGSRRVVLSAPPGAGKTVHLPLVLLQGGQANEKKILMLEPRRWAARRAAEFMAQQLREPVGRTVGYRIRGQSVISSTTRIEILTEGILTRMLHADPELPGVGLLIFDEFHERSIHADLGLALSLDVQQHLRPDLAILVMSATLDGCAAARLLHTAAVVQMNEQSFPVETHYARTIDRQPLELRTANAVLRALAAETGDLLVFLPGMREMRRVEEALYGRTPEKVQVHLLHGDLPLARQETALAPAEQRKVILATSIAETSLTIEGVRVVIDSGWTRRLRFDPRRGMSGLVTLPVSRAAADQRRGRAGRQGPGVCYRLWTESEQQQLAEYPIAEMQISDLANLALDLALWGDPLGQTLFFLDPPPSAHLARAQALLQRLGAMTANLGLTAHGKAMARLAIHPRLSHMILQAKEQGLGAEACELAALLEEPEPPFDAGRADPDLRVRLDRLRQGPAAVRERILAQKNKLLEMTGISTSSADHQPRAGKKRRNAGLSEQTLEQASGLLLALAYPDRVAARHPDRPNSYHLANGMIAALPGTSALSHERYLAVADVDAAGSEGKIYLAAPLSVEMLEAAFAHAIQIQDEVTWDSTEDRVRARRVRKLDHLVLEEKVIDPSAEQALTALLQGIRRAGLTCLPWGREAVRLQSRVEWARRHLPAAAGLTDYSESGLLDSLEIWLAPFLFGMHKLEHLQRLRLAEILTKRLTSQQRRDLDRLAPAELLVPSGSRITLEYPSEGYPVLAVKLQELFGMTETPRIGHGAVPITIHLLSPAGRPLAVTQDLASFWLNTYPEIRKQMRSRYPKHPWPEDPFTATPTRKTIRRP